MDTGLKRLNRLIRDVEGKIEEAHDNIHDSAYYAEKETWLAEYMRLLKIKDYAVILRDELKKAEGLWKRK